MKSFIEEI